MNYSEYTTRLNKNPVFASLRNLLRQEFPGLNVEECFDNRFSQETVGPDITIVQKIDLWTDANWTKAL